MACGSCAARQQAMTNMRAYIPPVVEQLDCVYTVEELQAKLTAAFNAMNWSQVSFIRSALNRYHINCNEFNNFIL